MKMSTRIITTTVSLLVLLLFFVGCAEQPYGIFASIERERKVVDERDLGNEINVAAVARAGERMFVAAGAAYSRAVDSEEVYQADEPNWQEWGDPIDAPASNYTTTSLVAADLGAGERVYAVYTSLNGDDSGLYELDPAHVDDGFTAVGGAKALSEVDAFLKAFAFEHGGTEWVVVSAALGPNEYALYASDDGTAFDRVGGSAFSTPAPVIDVATDGSTTVYLTAKQLYVTADAPDAGTEPAEPAGATGKTSDAAFTGTEYAAGTVWLADDAGHLYTSDDFGATDWTRNESPYDIGPTSSDPVPFTDFAAVPRGAETLIVVGTRGYGYRVIGDAATSGADTTPSSPGSTESNYEASDLSTSVVQTFFVDTEQVGGYPVSTDAGVREWTGTLLYAGTVNQGLWRALSSEDGAIQWVRE
ncbi:MAG: hypothetical protein ACOC0E_08025 [Spirochaetota bacterium]